MNENLPLGSCHYFLKWALNPSQDPFVFRLQIECGHKVIRQPLKISFDHLLFIVKEKTKPMTVKGENIRIKGELLHLFRKKVLVCFLA